MPRRKLARKKNKNAILTRELQMTTLCLQQEIGDKFTSLKDLQKDYENGAWKGRAQQMLKMQAKISELEEKLDIKKRDIIGERMKKKTDAVISSLEQKKRNCLIEAVRELSELRVELEDNKTKLDGARSRIRILECDSTKMRQKVTIMQEKSNHDDLLVIELNKKIAAVIEYYQEMLQDANRQIKKLNDQLQTIQLQLGNEQLIIEDYRSQVQEKVRKIDQLNTLVSKYADCSLQTVFYLPMKNANENEIANLTEMINALNRRLEKERENVGEKENKLLKSKEAKKHLKKQLWRFEIENKELREALKPARLSLVMSKVNGKQKRGSSLISQHSESTRTIFMKKISQEIEKKVSIEIETSKTDVNESCRCEVTPEFSSKSSASSEEEIKKNSFEHSEEIPEVTEELSEALEREFLKNKLEISDEKIKLLEDRMKMLEEEKAEDLDSIDKMLEYTKEQFAQALKNFRNDPKACTCDNSVA